MIEYTAAQLRLAAYSWPVSDFKLPTGRVDWIVTFPSGYGYTFGMCRVSLSPNKATNGGRLYRLTFSHPYDV